ncbi:putative E3 ubiquitin-protein ligase [Monocercomonoides exilis]|uniref:putative E3 ubiquitin-protein ligase n=1 Tax=Monocercomonoides exilis TaxID=2049356 RepID=UPI0035598EE4|nr:putative E3 ubiquitin-protein ligase [Monocercomonoides exilis]
MSVPMNEDSQKEGKFGASEEQDHDETLKEQRKNVMESLQLFLQLVSEQMKKKENESNDERNEIKNDGIPVITDPFTELTTLFDPDVTLDVPEKFLKPSPITDEIKRKKYHHRHPLFRRDEECYFPTTSCPSSFEQKLQSRMRGDAMELDGMTYEELSQLSDMIGTVDVGLTDEQFENLPTFQYDRIRVDNCSSKEEKKLDENNNTENKDNIALQSSSSSSSSSQTQPISLTENISKEPVNEATIITTSSSQLPQEPITTTTSSSVTPFPPSKELSTMTDKPSSSSSTVIVGSELITVPDEDDDTMLEKCPICQMEFEFGETLVTLPCVHSFHVDCAKQWLKKKKTCPYCKERVI